MSFDIPNLHIPDNSPEAKVIEFIISRDTVTPEEAIRTALRQSSLVAETPAQELLGAFSSPEDRACLDEAMSIVKAQRKDYDVIRKLEN